jgi:aspartate aminotransferase
MLFLRLRLRNIKQRSRSQWVVFTTKFGIFSSSQSAIFSFSSLFTSGYNIDQDGWVDTTVEGLNKSSTLRMSELQARAQETTENVYSLGFGRSPFSPPMCLLQAVKENAHQKEYLPVAGLASLRKRLAKQYTNRYKNNYFFEDVLIGPGSKQLIYLLQRAVSPGTEVCVVSPSWVSYAPQCKLTGHKLKVISTSFDEGWKLTPKLVKKAFYATKHTPRLLVFNAPCNPTGATYLRSELKALAVLLKETNTIVICDEIYADLTFGQIEGRGEGFVSLAQELPHQCIVTSGISKALSAGGYRLGYMVFPSSLSKIAKALISLGSETHSCAPTPIQFAYNDVLSNHEEELAEYQANCRRILQAICTNAANTLQSSGIRVVHARAAWYLLVDFSPHSKTLQDRHGIHTAVELCDHLMAEYGVSILYDQAFDSSEEPGALHARVSLVDFDGEAALRSLMDHSASSSLPHPLDETWLNAHCPRIIEGIRRMTLLVNADAGV